jgi:hypothetical protein
VRAGNQKSHRLASPRFTALARQTEARPADSGWLRWRPESVAFLSHGQGGRKNQLSQNARAGWIDGVG